MKIAAMTAVQAGLDILEIIKDQVNISLVIGLDEEVGTRNISGYVNIEKYCFDNNFKYIGLRSYALKDQADRLRLESEEIDVLLVLGWQRLVPEWLIDHVSIAVIGGHGSACGITAGRGRSPQNWALILGQQSFTISLFRIDKGIDSGPVFLERKFIYSPFDDIETSYFKTSWLMADMIVELLSNREIDLISPVPQNGEPSYLPKRMAEDGGIDWTRSNIEIYNFVRGLTHPYPGAYSLVNDIKVCFWRVIPFDIPVDNSRFTPGEICRVFGSLNFVIKCNDGFVLVREWNANNSNWTPKEGEKFTSINFKQSMQNIIDRHIQEMPGKRLSEEILLTTSSKQ